MQRSERGKTMTTGTDLMTRPECPKGHGAMTLRSTARTSREANWCGTWYDCTPREPGNYCTSSVLLPSPELLTQEAALTSA